MFKCQKCNKIYKREKALLKHQIKCQNKAKQVRPSLDQMWHLLLKQQKQINEQKKEIDKLNKIINKDIKTIDVVDWLNRNVKIEINYSEWIKRRILVSPQHMKLVMKSTYINAIPTILQELSLLEKKTIPIYCFNHKKKSVYIYEDKWIKCTKDHINMLYDIINIQLLNHNIEYEKTLDEKILYSKIHLENNQRLFITDTKKKDNINKKIKQELFNLFKIDLNELNKYKFYI
tara:strand:- start:4390 stop:5085 length:696 start_codon:yes stop_codon:yes gene_type:complete